MFNSIRWKFTTMFFMLVFIGMIISGVFIVNSFESFQLNDVSKKLNELSELMAPKFTQYDELEEYQESLQNIVINHKELGFREEIFVIGKESKRILATSTQNKGKVAAEILDFDLLMAGFDGKIEAKNMLIEQAELTLKTRDMVFPIKDVEGSLTGLMYIRYDLTDIYKTINTAKDIIIRATLLASVSTIILGFIVARTITEPINDLTEKASKMAAGDFNQIVDVKSDDEIGKLAEMFNHLTLELKRSVSEISREKSKLDSIINYMDDGLIAVDISGNIIHHNPKALELFNININLIESGFIYNIDNLFEKLDESLMIENIKENDETWIGSKNINFDEKSVKVSFAPFENEEGKKSGFVFVIQDITEEHKLDMMRRDFVANVSHELKTPLTSIKSYTETILDGLVDDPEMVNQFLGVVNDEADRMTRLVRDLLQLSNYDAKKVRFDVSENNYIALIEKAILKLDATAKQKNQKIEFITDKSEIIGEFDYDKIEQVVLNIMSNAIKYTLDDGTIKVFINSAEGDIILKVEDNGIGIPKEDIDHIFERFYRVDKARSRALGGTGLGLSIAKQIIQTHNGTIQIESKVDVGTTITMRIPLKYTPEEV